MYFPKFLLYLYCLRGRVLLLRHKIIINIPAAEIENLRAATAGQPRFLKPAKGNKNTKTYETRHVCCFLCEGKR